MDQTIVTIEVGLEPEAKEFIVHRDLLCKASPYFQSAFKGEFKEAQDRIITLDDVSTRTFGIFQTWLYSGTLVLPEDSEAYLDPKRDHPKKCSDCGLIDAEDDPAEDWCKELLDIFVLADKYNVPLLRREAMITVQHLDEICGSRPSFESACEAFERLPSTSPYCGYVVDMYKHWWSPAENQCSSCGSCSPLTLFNAEKTPRSLMFEIMKASHHKNEDPTFKNGKTDWCAYHEHNSEEEVKACRAQRKLEGRFGEYEYLDGEEDGSDHEAVD